MRFVWAYIQIRLAIWFLRLLGRLIKWGALAAVLVAAAPVTVVAAAGYGGAWLRGWPPVRLWRSAAWALPMTAAYLAGQAVATRTWQAVVLAPVRDWQVMWSQALHGQVAAAAVRITPTAVPAGLALAGALWAWRIYALQTGLAGAAATAPVTFDLRQWRRQARTARGRIAAPGAVPLLTAKGEIAVGGTIRAIQHRWRPITAIPPALLGRHQVIVGATGTGKTNLMMRLWAGWFAAAWQRFLTGRNPRPLLVVWDCKGGPDARAKAARTRRLLQGVGAGRVAIWPDEAPLSLWALPPAQLAVTLLALIETGTGAAAYYADVMQAIVALAVGAPCGPPGTSRDFLQRLDPAWLASAYSGDGYAAEQAAVTEARRHIGDVALRFQTLFARLGAGFDGPGDLAGADVWYCILEGTREPAVAEAQAMALMELLAHAATSRDGQPRQILLAADDYSAVSRRVPVWNLYERGRSLGLGVQISAQSWQGLGETDDERARICATADGGVWVLRTPYPEPLAQLAGTRRVLESAHKLVGHAWGDEGTSRVQHAWVLDPDIARSLDVGQAAFIHHGGVTWVQVARPRPSPLQLPPPPPQPARVVHGTLAGDTEPAPPPQRESGPPGGSEFSDDVFGSTR